MVNPPWQGGWIPQDTGIRFHTHLPTVFTLSVVVANFQAVPQRPKTLNKQGIKCPREIYWETHTGIKIFHCHYIFLLLLFHWQVQCIELTCDILVVGVGRGIWLQGQKNGWTWTHTTHLHWLVLTCKHFWNFAGCWARTGPVSEKLCWDFCLLGDSETLRTDHPVRGEKSLKSYVHCWEKNSFFSLIPAAGGTTDFTQLLFTTVFSSGKAELEKFCALHREDRVTELLVLHCPVFTACIATV